MIAFHPIYVHELPENHRFPMEKYDLLPRQLIHEGTIEQSQFFAPSSIDNRHVEAVHCGNYLQRLRNLEMTKKEQLHRQRQLKMVHLFLLSEELLQILKIPIEHLKRSLYN